MNQVQIQALIVQQLRPLHQQLLQQHQQQQQHQHQQHQQLQQQLNAVANATAGMFLLKWQ